MKKFLIPFICLIFLSQTYSLVKAQDSSTDTSDETPVQTQVDQSTTKATNKYFDLTLTEGFQSPLDKSISYTLTIVPHIDSSKTQIIWNMPSSITASANNNSFVSLVAETEYKYKATIKPTVAGTYSINVSVISWQYDVNYTNSVTDTLELSSNLVSEPITETYILSMVAEVVIILGLSTLAIWGGIKITKKLLKRTKKWLTPPV
jgi:hypothetical protein